MKVLVACEESQAVTIELRKLGHEAYSCDLVECSGGHPEWHIQGDVLKILNPSEQRVLMGSTPTPFKNEHAVTPWRGITFRTMDGKLHIIEGKWDLIIAHPPCTHLAVSGARHFFKKLADGRQRDAVEFFCKFLTADCDRIVIENPVGIISGEYVQKNFPDLCEKYGLPIKPTQIVQPFEFGDPSRKTTCLWLIGVDKLQPTNVVEPELLEYICADGRKVTFSKDYCRTKGERGCARSKTYPGIARALAEQIGGECK